MSIALATGFVAGTVPRWVWWALGTVLVVGALGVQEFRIAKIETELADARGTLAEERASAEAAARDWAEQKVELQAQHAKFQQEFEDEWNREKARMDERRRADAAVVAGLRNKIAAFTARGGAAGQADTAPPERAADRLEALGRVFQEGVELVVEGRDIVERRDAEVKRLVDQIAADRAACDVRVATEPSN
jgi:hypothetical protein